MQTNTYVSPFSTRYASDEMQYLFSADNKFITWHKLWIALAKAEKRAGLPITQEQIDELEAHVNDVDYALADEYERKLRHDVMAHIHAYGEQCPKAMPIIHLGATSCYVGDNTDLILMREGLGLIRDKLVRVLAVLADFSDKYKSLPTLGFTHFQPAQLVTVGKRATLWMNELLMDLEEVEYRIDNLKLLGDVDLASPKTINLYASTFADKDAIADAIDAYNSGADEEDQIEYTDYVALLMSSVTTIINAISYVLIAFVAISLVVSSIMIGIITYISVLERTKEIGILRAIGASKRDISRVFNAETLIEGFCSGAIGIGVTLLLIIPINLVVHRLTGIESLNAILPPVGGAALVVISMALTFIAGLIPSGIAARKDPVEALRTE